MALGGIDDDGDNYYVPTEFNPYQKNAMRYYKYFSIFLPDEETDAQKG